MKPSVALRLGRVSNLPTVATNAIAGLALAGGAAALGTLALVMLAAALAYTAGMFLNDAFDAETDALNQSFRPIPAGHATRREVFAYGYAMLAGSVALFAATGLMTGAGWQPGAAGLVLAGLIVAYNRHHKENAFGPLLMGLCRVLVYVAAGLTVATVLPAWVWIGAGLLLAHVMGLTFLAKNEGGNVLGRIWPVMCLALPAVTGLAISPGQPIVLPFALALGAVVAYGVGLCFRNRAGDVGRAIPVLISAISLLDAMLAASQGHWQLALLAALAMPLTLWLQRWVRGT